MGILTVVVHKVEGEVEVGHTHGLSDEVKIPERAFNSKTGPSRAPLTFSRNIYRVSLGSIIDRKPFFLAKLELCLQMCGEEIDSV